MLAEHSCACVVSAVCVTVCCNSIQCNVTLATCCMWQPRHVVTNCVCWPAGNQASIKVQAKDSILCQNRSCKAGQREYQEAGELQHLAAHFSCKSAAVPLCVQPCMM